MAPLHPNVGTQTTTSGFIGEAFGGGGYFEANFQFDPDQVTGGVYPAWWGDAVEHLKSGSSSNASQYWNYYDEMNPTDPSSAHWVETDFFEYNMPSGYYGGTMIDWYGDYNKQVPNNWSNVQSPWTDKQLKYPVGTDYTIPHKYGFLWIPATVSTNGSATFYLDGVPYSSQAISWNQYQGQASYTTFGTNQQPPTPWSWSVLDQQHIAIVLNTPSAQPVTIFNVDVWQANANWNIHTNTLYDTLYDLSKVHSSSNMGIGRPNTGTPAADYNGDNYFAERSTLGTGILVYNLANISSFTARVYCYSTSSPSNVAFAVSKTGADGTWVNVPVTSTTPHPVGTQGGFSYDDLSNSGAIGSGYNYLRVTMSGGSYAWDTALGQIRID
jgi:hypothetical protein